MIKFGTDGWRAIISEEFTFDNVRKVASAIAAYLNSNQKPSPSYPSPCGRGKSERSRGQGEGQPQIIIGYDARFLADKFAIEIAKVMKENGISSLITERDCPTPIVAWSVKDKNALGAIMLTASHNPPQYCGIKFIPDYAGPATEDITRQIEKNLAQNPHPLIPLPQGEGSPSEVEDRVRAQIERFEPRERYFEYIEKFIDVDAIRKAKLKVLYDPMYGSGRGYLDKLLQMYGCKTEEIHNYRDVLFGGQNPEPGDKELAELKAKVVEGKFDLGLANDGDADRFGVVDEHGSFLDANKIIALVFNYLVSKGKKGVVVRSIATTSLIDAIAAEHKIKLHETKVGFKYIAEIMMREKVIIGGEESGGLTIDGHIPEKDGLLADLLVVEMVAKSKKPLSQLWKDLISKYGAYEFRRGKVETTEEKKQKLMEELRERPPTEVGGMKVVEVKTTDGVKIILEDGSWLLVRPSGTEPIIRVYYESKDPAVLNNIAQYVKGLV